MINFSLNTCWRLIPTKGQKEAAEIQRFLFFRPKRAVSCR